MAAKKRQRQHAEPADPYAEREALRYENPIPSREMIMMALEDHGKPLSREQLLVILNIDDSERAEAFSRRLQAMERDGQLHRTRKHEYGLVEKMSLIPGRVIGHRDGFGFVVPDDGSEDLFLSAYYMRTVFDGDRVLVRVTHIDRRGRREAALVQVLEHKITHIVGRFMHEDGVNFVMPDHKRITHEIIVPKGEEGGAHPGQIVNVLITGQPAYHRRAIGRVIEVLGDKRAPGMESAIAIRAHGLPHEWPEDVLREAENFQELTPGAQYADREDLRDLPFVTIDGEDAKDFDDAVYCVARPRGGWQLYVAIADVSHYVRPGIALDSEAVNRGNSVYFPDFVIPMLPENLSNGLCSLKPNVDRFALVCDMLLSAQGAITRYKFYPAVIRSQARLTYNSVAKALGVEQDRSNDKKEEQAGAHVVPQALLPHLEAFHQLYQQLIANRKERGALDFETVETKVIFDEGRKIEAIVPVVRNDAHKMIEEAMLCANVCAAKWLEKHKVPVLYRVHEGPTAEKLADLRDFLKEFSLGLRGGKNPEPADYANLLQIVRPRPDARLIQTVLLRSLKQAVYTPNNSGHFGLAYPAYTHFTSPIRRYPDLLIHRAIRARLSLEDKTLKKTAKLKNKLENMIETDMAKLTQIGEYCSFTERRADEATRDAMDGLKCEFVSDRVGEEFAGLITAVTGFGIFVELTDLYVEGLVHISTLPSDYYRFDPVHHRLIGERTLLELNLGDRVHVKVARVDIDEKKIDLELLSSKKYGKILHEPKTAAPKNKKKRRRRR